MRALRYLLGVFGIAALALGGTLAFVEPETLTLAQAQATHGGDYADLPDGKLRYELVDPDPQRPLVVFVHGGALNSLDVWDPLFAALDRSRIGTLRFDSYGQGYSARPEVRHDATLYVRTLDALLDLAARDRTVHLVGYSQGGLIATEYAAHRPARVASLVLIAPAGLGTQLRWPVRVGGWPVVGEAVYRLRGHAILVEGYDRMSHAERYRAHVLERETPWLAIEGTGRSLLSQLRSLPIEQRAGAYRFVGASDVPTLAIFGADDATVPPASAEVLMELVPEAETKVLADASHALVFDDAARVAPLVQAFVAAH
jgi:pimeloyl-ACP methyl ester carboxylesterase